MRTLTWDAPQSLNPAADKRTRSWSRSTTLRSESPSVNRVVELSDQCYSALLRVPAWRVGLWRGHLLPLERSAMKSALPRQLVCRSVYLGCGNTVPCSTSSTDSTSSTMLACRKILATPPIACRLFLEHPTDIAYDIDCSASHAYIYASIHYYAYVGLDTIYM